MVREWKVTKNQGQKIAVPLRWTRKKATEQKKKKKKEKKTAWKKQEPVTKMSGESGKPGISCAIFTF